MEGVIAPSRPSFSMDPPETPRFLRGIRRGGIISIRPKLPGPFWIQEESAAVNQSVEQTRESRFGQAALEMGLLAEEQLKEAVGIQGQLRELGVIPKALTEICIEKGHLTREQVGQVEERLRQKEDWPQIPGYQLQSRLGRGGMGAVFKARQESLDRTVAIKVLSPRLEGDEIYISRFLREARAVARLNHKNVIAGIDVGEANGHHYFVMEHVDGETASRRLEREGPLQESEVVSIGIQMAHALAHAAENNLVHRDVKPQNIILTEKGVAKLCDLGLAKETEAPALAPSGGRSLGTPYYISPEQAKGGEFADIRSDIYSLGATLYNLATGEPPFGGPSALVIMTKQMTESPPSARRKNRSVSIDLDRIILKMMEKRKEDRYPTPEALLEELQRLEGGGKGVRTAGRRRRVVRRARREGGVPPGAIIAVVVILVVGVLAIAIGSGSKGSVERPAATWDQPANDALMQVTTWLDAHPEAEPAVRIRRLERVVEGYPGTSAAERAAAAIMRIRSGR